MAAESEKMRNIEKDLVKQVEESKDMWEKSYVMDYVR